MSSEMLTRARPAFASSAAVPASLVPFVVMETSVTPGIPAIFATNSGMPPRTSGSPPVTLTRSTPYLATSHATAEASSVRVGISPRGTSGTPSSGMQ